MSFHVLVGEQGVKLPQVILMCWQSCQQPVCVEGKQRCLLGSVAGSIFLEEGKQPREVRLATRHAEILLGAAAGGTGERRAGKERAAMRDFCRGRVEGV